MELSEEFQNNPEVLLNYELLNRIGVFDTITAYHRSLRSMEELISDAVEIFNRHSVDQLISYITSTLSNRFVPQYLQFVFTTHGHEENLKNVCFHNLKEVESPAPVQSLEVFRRFFSHYPGTIGFSLFEYSIQDAEVVRLLSPLKPEIIVPVNGPEDLYGIIIVGNKITNGEYSSDEVVYIDRLMKFVSISLQNSIHYTSSVTDYKTRLYNHSFFIKRLNEEIAKLRRYEHSFSILLIDIDYFKKLNDKYGHLAGDRVLFYLARKLEESTREEDVIARFGGEEFIVLLPVCDQESAEQVAERIREKIETMEISHMKDSLSVTVSVGIHTVNSVRLADAESLIARADEALYSSKEAGRNRVSHYRAGLLFRASAFSH
jgi:diguanylate cyclase (GGDEF)-like protein